MPTLLRKHGNFKYNKQSLSIWPHKFLDNTAINQLFYLITQLFFLA